MTDGTGNVGCDIEFGKANGRERQHHKIHEQKYHLTVQQAEDYRPFRHKPQLAAGHVKHNGCGEFDGEVTEQADCGRVPSHLKCATSEYSPSDALQDSERFSSQQTEANESLRDVTNSGQKSAPEDCQHWALAFGANSWNGNTTHPGLPPQSALSFRGWPWISANLWLRDFALCRWSCF